MTMCAYWISSGMALAFASDCAGKKWLGLGVATVALLVGMARERMLINKIRELGGDRV